MPCAAACPTDALTLPPAGWAGYRLASLELVADRCVTFQGTPCGVCARACPVGEAALAMDEGGHPVIRAEGCVGCGVCVRACITTPSSFKLHLAES
jgi:NAD-dependent dihydropyrimidine dehydrogenase PreA subunit